MLELDEGIIEVRIRYRRKNKVFSNSEFCYAKMPLEKAKELWKKYVIELGENKVIS